MALLPGSACESGGQVCWTLGKDASSFLRTNCCLPLGGVAADEKVAWVQAGGRGQGADLTLLILAPARLCRGSPFPLSGPGTSQEKGWWQEGDSSLGVCSTGSSVLIPAHPSSIYPSTCPPTHSSIHPFIHPSLHPPNCPSILLSIHLSIHPPVLPSTCPLTHSCICPCIRPSICSSIHLSFHPPLHPPTPSIQTALLRYN